MLLDNQILRIFEIMESRTVITEARQGFLRYLKTRFPEVPDYVIKDLFYKLKTADKNETLKFLELFSSYDWSLVKDMDITFDTFKPEHQYLLKKRMSGEIRDYVPKDAERHEIQKNKLETVGLSEPIILTKYPDQNFYWLDEGWHRTIQMFNKFPEGFVYPNVYVGTYKLPYSEYQRKYDELFPEWKEIRTPLSNTH